MKKIVMSVVLMIGSICFADVNLKSQSLEDVKSILSDNRFQVVVGQAEISSIQNLGRRHYLVNFGTCSLTVAVVSTCAPMPGGPCASEVRFDSSSVVCLP